MARAAGALQQPRHALGRSDLQHTLDRQEVHAQVQAGGAHDGFECPVLQALLHPLARRLVQRAVVQRDDAGPLGLGVQQRLVPELGLRARVGEDQRGAAGLDLGHHLRQHRQPQVPAPGEALGAARQQRIDDQLLGHGALHQRAGRAGPEQRVHRLAQVAQRGRHAPGEQARVPAAQPRQRQLHLHAALVAQQLVPLVHHDQRQVLEHLARIGAGQQQRQALGRGDQHGGQAPVLRGALARGRVAAARAGAPVRGQRCQRLGQRAQRVGRQRAHGREPQHRERRRYLFDSC